MECCAQISYGPVHSDICPPDHKAANMNSKSWRLLIHECLDEFLNNAATAGDKFEIVLYGTKECRFDARFDA